MHRFKNDSDLGEVFILWELFKNVIIYFDCAGSLLLPGFFLSCREPGLLSGCSTWASHCSGFSCGARALGVQASVFVASWISCGSQTLEHMLSHCGAQA